LLLTLLWLNRFPTLDWLKEEKRAATGDGGLSSSFRPTPSSFPRPPSPRRRLSFGSPCSPPSARARLSSLPLSHEASIRPSRAPPTSRSLERARPPVRLVRLSVIGRPQDSLEHGFLHLTDAPSPFMQMLVLPVSPFLRPPTSPNLSLLFRPPDSSSGLSWLWQHWAVSFSKELRISCLALWPFCCSEDRRQRQH
jgi:hypothetical protein